MSNPRHWLVKQRKFLSCKKLAFFYFYLTKERFQGYQLEQFFFCIFLLSSLILFTAGLPFTVGVYFSSAIKLLPFLFSVWAPFSGTCFQIGDGSRPCACCYEAGSDEIKWNFCLKNNYISIRVERVLQCKKNCHR